MIDFPNNPSPGDPWQPPGSPFVYEWDPPVWKVIGSDTPIGIGLAAQQQAAAGTGYEIQSEVDLSTVGDFFQIDLLAGCDYEFQILGGRPTADDYRLSMQVSTAGVWNQGSTGYGYQISGNESDSTEDFFAEVRWENNQGRGYITASQTNNIAKPPSRVSAYIQSHDLADAQTIAYGTCTSYASTPTPFLIANFYTRYLTYEVNDGVRFTYINSVGTRTPFLEGVGRVYSRQRI